MIYNFLWRGGEKLEKMVEWTKLKMRIHSKEERIIYFNEREVWWASVGINIGNEVDGKNGYFERPVLVLKKNKPKHTFGCSANKPGEDKLLLFST